MARLVLCFTAMVCLVSTVTEGQDGESVGFVLNGVDYPNGSTVLRTDIGEGDAALMCTTDRAGCCTGPQNRNVQFHFPNGTQVPNLLSDPNTCTYYRKKGIGFVRLNRRSKGKVTGQFCCRIPDINGTKVKLFINIIDITVSIATSGINIDGETYSLECSATVIGSTDQPTITWLDAMNNTVPSGMVTTTGSMSTLTFNPLVATQAGTYTCTVSVGSSKQSETMNVTIQRALATPLNVQATQCSLPGPVEVSWSPPSSGVSNITGYTIYYGNGDKVSLPADITYIGLSMEVDTLGQTVSIRSEDNYQLLVSKLVTATIAAPGENRQCNSDADKLFGSFSSEVYIVICVVTPVVSLVTASVVIIMTLTCGLRRKKASKDSAATLKFNINKSSGLYENPEGLTETGRESYDMTQCPVYESTTNEPQSSAHQDELQSNPYELQ